MRIRWSILETHKENYDGTCRFCGGRCDDEQAIAERQRVLEERATAEGARLAYINRRYERTFTYHF